jgi:hypothetical protein
LARFLDVESAPPATLLSGPETAVRELLQMFPEGTSELAKLMTSKQ